MLIGAGHSAVATSYLSSSERLAAAPFNSLCKCSHFFRIRQSPHPFLFFTLARITIQAINATELRSKGVAD